jgi:2-polyprenyl-3-methyl-5-hydroxy-6-metoxy-1,4-benzoquinol methylase
LDAHINPEIGVASRTSTDIDKTVNMIDKMVRPGTEILDLGCGPGLYAERLSKKGHKVTGVDFSKNSIDYAIKQRGKNQSTIEYISDNYLNLDFEGQFDFIMMIYCDFGVLVSEERISLMKMIHKALKPGGIFLFDAIDEETIERLNFNSSWEMSKGGFWKPTPYICLSKSFHFKENKATLDQHLVMGEDDSFQLYRFWNHYFDQEDVEKIFRPIGFSKVESIKNLLTGSGPYNDHGVVFYAVSK